LPKDEGGLAEGKRRGEGTYKEKDTISRLVRKAQAPCGKKTI